MDTNRDFEAIFDRLKTETLSKFFSSHTSFNFKIVTQRTTTDDIHTIITTRVPTEIRASCIKQLLDHDGKSINAHFSQMAVFPQLPESLTIPVYPFFLPTGKGEKGTGRIEIIHAKFFWQQIASAGKTIDPSFEYLIRLKLKELFLNAFQESFSPRHHDEAIQKYKTKFEFDASNKEDAEDEMDLLTVDFADNLNTDVPELVAKGFADKYIPKSDCRFEKVADVER